MEDLKNREYFTFLRLNKEPIIIMKSIDLKGFYDYLRENKILGKFFFSIKTIITQIANKTMNSKFEVPGMKEYKERMKIN